MQLLTDFLKGKPKEFDLSFEAVDAIKQLKDKLAQTSSFMYPNSLSSLALMMGTSEKAVGGTLNQLVKKPVNRFFIPKRLASSETMYSNFGRELLAICVTIKYFRHMLEGRDFIVLTDHIPPPKH